MDSNSFLPLLLVTTWDQTGSPALAVAHLSAQVLIEPTVDPTSVLGDVGTVAGPLQGVDRRGYSDGPKEQARFNGPKGVTIGSRSRRTYIADTLNHVIRLVSGDSVSTIAGAGVPGFMDGVGQKAEFYSPRGLAASPEEDVLYVADSSNHAIRRLALSTRHVTTIYHGRGHVAAESRLAFALAEAAATPPPPDSYTYTYEDGSNLKQSAAFDRDGPSGLWNPQALTTWPEIGDGSRG